MRATSLLEIHNVRFVSVRVGKIWFGITAAVGLLAIIGDVVLLVQSTPAHVVELGGDHGYAQQFESAFSRAIVPFYYFTILSNIVVMITNGMLSVR